MTDAPAGQTAAKSESKPKPKPKLKSKPELSPPVSEAPT